MAKTSDKYDIPTSHYNLIIGFVSRMQVAAATAMHATKKRGRMARRRHESTG